MNTTADAIENLAIESVGMTEKDKSTRKHWLIATLCNFFGLPIILFSVVVIFTRVNLTEIVLFTFGLALSTTIPFWIIYRCAYRKPGTRWLTFCLIMGFVQFFSSSANLLSDAPEAWLIIVISLPICVWWYVLSLKLRKINKKLQQLHKLLKS